MPLELVGQFSPSVYLRYLNLLLEAGIQVDVDDSEVHDLRGVKIPVVKLLVAAEDLERARELILKS